ncbi:MAG TPA: hypothetical protein GX707_12000 [Epulopiscium sp.]|nr:hypothetical protein [Candidatus Epulonipiscium sp.]
MLDKHMLDDYFKEQRENAKLRNKIRFTREYKDYLTFKQKIKYLIRYSPSINTLARGRAFADGMRK